MSHASSSTFGRRTPWILTALLAVLAMAAFGAAQLRSAGSATNVSPLPTSSPTATFTPTQAPSATPSRTPSPSVTPTRTRKPTAKPTPTSAPADEGGVDDNIARYPGRPLSRNDSAAPSDTIRVVQQRLADAGFVVVVNGVFGASTQRAVKKFQGKDKLPVTGIIDEATWNALFLLTDS